MGKIEYEKQGVSRMIHLYCRKKHNTPGDLCKECETLKQYAFDRLVHCPFKEHKAACKDCTVHCYRKDMRAEIRKVMRFSGPRMILYHPLDVLKHLIK